MTLLYYILIIFIVIYYLSAFLAFRWASKIESEELDNYKRFLPEEFVHDCLAFIPVLNTWTCIAYIEQEYKKKQIKAIVQSLICQLENTVQDLKVCLDSPEVSEEDKVKIREQYEDTKKLIQEIQEIQENLLR